MTTVGRWANRDFATTLLRICTLVDPSDDSGYGLDGAAVLRC